jgi:plastocyanin
MASYGGLPATYTPTATNTVESSGGSGATHTVIVAPTQGVLRFVPFALNASVGDTIQFMWGANNHTVTKSSELTPCNKTSDALFTSGEQNLGFVFTQVVNDTNPTFYYCGTPTHCEKGMFGIINPPNAAGASTSVSNMMPSIAMNSSDVMGYAAYTANQTNGNVAAATWGSNIDLATLPTWSHSLVAENVLFTRNLLAVNPDIIQTDGSVNLGAAGNNPLMIPQDLAAVLANAAPAASSAPVAVATPAVAAGSTPSGSGTSAAASSTQSSGAFGMSSPKVVVALVAAFATFMMM